MLHHRAAVGIAAGVAGVIVQGLVVQGVEPGGVEGVRHHPAHGAHVEVPVGGAGTVPRAVPQPCREPVVLSGMSVHDEDLRVGAVPLHRKGERVGDLGGNVGAGDAGVVLDAAAAAGNVFLPAALRIVLFQDGTGSLRAGLIAFQRDKVGFNVTGRQGGSLLCRLCLCFLRGFAHGLCGILGEVFPAQVKGGLHGWQRPDDHRRQREEQLVRKQCQPQRKACRCRKRQGMPAPRHFPPAHGTSPPSAK